MRKVGTQKIQIIEGNPHLRSILSWNLQQVGYSVQQSASIHQVRSTNRSILSTLVIIDSDLPDGDGVELCRWLYEQGQPLILMISAREGERDIVNALNAGADDYLTKPFGMQEFMARVEALLRRLRSARAPLMLNFSALQIDLVQRRVISQGKLIDLTPQEFSLLYVLAQAEGKTLSRVELLHRAWSDDVDNPRTVDTHVLSLRKKIEFDPKKPYIVQTMRNVGYRFNPQMCQEFDSPEKESSSHLQNGNGSYPNHTPVKDLAMSHFRQ